MRGLGHTFRRGFLCSSPVSLSLSSAFDPDVLRHGTALTNARSLSDIDGQIGLRPARLESVVCSRGGGDPTYRLIVAGAMRNQGESSSALQRIPNPAPEKRGSRWGKKEGRDGESHVECNDVGGKLAACQVLATPKPLYPLFVIHLQPSFFVHCYWMSGLEAGIAMIPYGVDLYCYASPLRRWN